MENMFCELCGSDLESDEQMAIELCEACLLGAWAWHESKLAEAIND